MKTYKQYLNENSESPKYDVLKKHQKPLTEKEKKEIFKNDAVWNFSAVSTDPNSGKKVNKRPAVWKSEVNGKEWFVTDTHRAYKVKPTLKGAIASFHNFIKSTA